MAVSILLLVGIAVAVFVGFNIGGSSTGVAFGPAVGSGTLSKLAAAALMSVFALLGGGTLGRNVIDTMGGEIVGAQFTLVAGVAVLSFVGGALLLSNLFGVPASTSMTAVGAIAGMGAAIGRLNEGVMLGIVTWWFVAPILAFWVCAVIGRYFYPYLSVRFHVDRSEGPLVTTRRIGSFPYVDLRVHGSTREVVGSTLVVVIGCYMAFSAGASNVANAVAPLVGADALRPLLGANAVGRGNVWAYVLLGGGAIGLGAFTIARRTLDTVGNDLTDLPLLAALIVETVSASIITFLSFLGIPASLAVSATMCIVGLGWGRATRTTTISDAASAAVRGEGPREDAGTEGLAGVSVNALAVDDPGDDVPPIGEEESAELAAGDLFDPQTTGRVIMLWILTPSLAALASYLLFEFGSAALDFGFPFPY